MKPDSGDEFKRLLMNNVAARNAYEMAEKFGLTMEVRAKCVALMLAGVADRLRHEMAIVKRNDILDKPKIGR